MTFFEIAGIPIGGSHTFVIAEIGNNHNGSVQLAKSLIDAAKTAGADCVKFQIRDMATLYRTAPGDDGSEDLGVEYVKDLLSKVEIDVAGHQELRKYAQEVGIAYMCTPWDERSVDVLAGFDVSAIKLASADLINPYLIKKASTLGKPLVLSTGMSYEHEILRAVSFLKELPVPFALLHCNSAYPAPEEDINLRYIDRLRAIHPFIGYSGHERGVAISIAAVALGACIIERHLTLDRMMEGPDHPASLESIEFAALVAGIREVEKAVSSKMMERKPSQGEMLNRENLSKSVVAARDIKRGATFTESDLRIASPGQGLPPYRLPDVLNHRANRDIRTGDFLFESDLADADDAIHNYKFPILWGVPVRYHDFKTYAARVRPDLFEFHLSYRDLSLKPDRYLLPVDCRRLVIHAPELFENSELLDLVSEDLAYRARSIDNIKRVIDVSEQMRAYFPEADSALIVANIGGISMDVPLPAQRRAALYDRFFDVVSKIEFGSTELIPQNMAPFPWHFGGQRHQNIFMMPQELADEAARGKMRLCLDLSHLQMTCRHFGLSFQAELEKLLPHSAHLHIADALGVNGEGVLLGEGDIDWAESWRKIRRYPALSFIPEVWQGHKDHGAGFWQALDFLSKIEGSAR
jgi:sialic acid synthase SpsE/sugar phosphate isomerase/epimerase